ncbi:DUF1573 domain-containing protein [Candidatus Peregrinibacteria bacterium]|nr:DUF1573 domain-containing protein [Candidatus Peregrinibacteria bacterium]
MKKLIIILVLAAGAFGLAGCVVQNSAPKIEVIPASYDFGEIVQSKGKVSTDFVVKNIGLAPLKFNKISTSCGCTVAEMDKSDLTAGESRNMKVHFDPEAHKDQFGPVVRMVYLQTSDPETPELEVQIKANVIK